jgi:hypothetical protein
MYSRKTYNPRRWEPAQYVLRHSRVITSPDYWIPFQDLQATISAYSCVSILGTPSSSFDLLVNLSLTSSYKEFCGMIQFPKYEKLFEAIVAVMTFVTLILKGASSRRSVSNMSSAALFDIAYALWKNLLANSPCRCLPENSATHPIHGILTRDAILEIYATVPFAPINSGVMA